MYSYYALSVVPSLKDKLWWKNYITLLQLVSFFLNKNKDFVLKVKRKPLFVFIKTQFVLVFMHTIYGIVLSQMGLCGFPLWGQYLLAVYITIIFVLFTNFYNQEYVTKSNKAKKEKLMCEESTITRDAQKVLDKIDTNAKKNY